MLTIWSVCPLMERCVLGVLTCCHSPRWVSGYVNNLLQLVISRQNLLMLWSTVVSGNCPSQDNCRIVKLHTAWCSLFWGGSFMVWPTWKIWLVIAFQIPIRNPCWGAFRSRVVKPKQQITRTNEMKRNFSIIVNSKWQQANCFMHGETQVTTSRLAVVLNLFGWESGAGFVVTFCSLFGLLFPSRCFSSSTNDNCNLLFHFWP